MAFSLDSRPDLDVHAESERLSALPLEEVMAWATETFAHKGAIGTSFQGAGLVAMDHAFRKQKLDLPVFTIDTGLLFPETHELKTRIQTFYDIEIESLHPEQTLEEQEVTMGPELWKTRPDTCCQMRKVMPLQTKLAKLDLWITGMRRGSTAHREERSMLELYEFDKLRNLYLLKLNPMLEWSREEVWDYLRENEIPYNPLHDRGYQSIGCIPCTKAAGEGEGGERAGRWEGFDKEECGIHTFLGSNI